MLRPRPVQLLFVSLLLLLRPTVCQALFTGDFHGRFSLLGKLKLQATFRTSDTPDNNPIPIVAGDLVTQRNLAFLEFRHNLGSVTPWLQLEYFLQARFFYDAAWVVGPDVLKNDDVRRYYLFDNRDQINDRSWAAELFTGYVDFTSGPLFLRVGRQILSWGEMSTFRILDNINPLDTSSLAVDLLERLVPLWMLRANLAFKNVGPFSSVSVEGYYINGAIDNTNGEDMIDGSPIIPPVGRCTQDDLDDCSDPLDLCKLEQVITQVEDDYDADRYGARLGMMLGGVDLNVAYLRIYSDIPVPFIDMDSFRPFTIGWEHVGAILADGFCDPIGTLLAVENQKLDVVLKIDKVDVYGGSFNYSWPLIDTVIRGEFALFKNVPKMTSGSVRDMIEGMGSKIYLPIDDLTLANILARVPLGDLETMALPFSSGQIATFDVLKYGIGLDKWTKIPFLNREDFLFILEYVGSKTLGYKENTILIPWQGPNGETLYEPEYSNTFILITNTNYLNGNLTTQLVTMFEVESQALSLIPSIRYQWRKLEWEFSYFQTFSSSYVGNLGMLESRNEFTANFAFYF